jgi:hypothetical protein
MVVEFTTTFAIIAYHHLSWSLLLKWSKIVWSKRSRYGHNPTDSSHIMTQRCFMLCTTYTNVWSIICPLEVRCLTRKYIINHWGLMKKSYFGWSGLYFIFILHLYMTVTCRHTIKFLEKRRKNVQIFQALRWRFDIWEAIFAVKNDGMSARNSHIQM